MAEFSCAAAGADSCGWKTSADSEEELVGKVADHLQKRHGVKVVSATLAKYAAAIARGEARPAQP